MKILFTTLSFVLGLYFLRNNIVFSIVISLIYVVFVFLRFSKKSAAFFLLVFIGGAILGNLNFEYNNKEGVYHGMVVEVKENYFIFLSHYEKFYIYEENTSKEFGDFLTITSKPSEYVTTNYESQFDFNEFLHNKGVKRSLTLKDYKIDFENPFRIHYRKQQILSGLNDDAKTLVNILICNEKDYSSQVVQQFDALNLMYLLSLSGIYLHFLFISTTYLFGLFASKKVSQLIPFLLFSPLLFFSFPRISTLRVFLIYLLRYINEHFLKKRFSYLALLSGLALFFLIIDYHLAYQQSFYIGFSLSLLGIYLRNGIKILGKRKSKFVLSIYAYSFVFPISSTNGYLLHLFAFPFQLMLIPFLLAELLLSYLRILTHSLSNLINTYSTFLVGISKSLLKLDITLPIKVNEWFFFIYYVSFVLILYLLESQRIRHSRNVSLALAGLVCISLIPLNLSNAVRLINVGQGDSILIQNRNKTVLVDTGGNQKFDMASETLIPYFHKIGVNHIDLLITTHNDFDHSGAVSSLMQNFKVRSYVSSRDAFPCRVGDIYLENINFYNGDENDSSLVLKLNFMNKKWLFTGDASIASEKAMIASGVDLDCDILKVGHHGSKTSTSEEFLKATSPIEAIISCGAKNKYGHPHKEVIELLEKYHVKIRRTDVEGTISYRSMFA